MIDALYNDKFRFPPFCFLSAVLSICLFFTCSNKDKSHMIEINIIPKPTYQKIESGNTNLLSIEKIITQTDNIDEMQIAKMVQKLISPINNIEIETSQNKKPNTILILLADDKKSPNENYSLKIENENRIELKAPSYSGLFYAYQSLRQLCGSELENGKKPKNTILPNVKIVDSPAFKYRGMHLDVSRHFFDVKFIKTYIDMIALHKMNVFHWHLTDDNGWRIEIDKYPLLTEKSAWRVDRRHEPWKKQSHVKNNEHPSYGGYYSKDEIREIVDYAAARNIMVIPEIEMPGHTSEVFAAYPELSCKGEIIPVNPGSYWPNTDIFCAGNDEVFEFLKNVLKEIIELFPGPYIHIGGDEADKLNWKSCPKCQRRILNKKLEGEHELQSWFIKEIEKFIVLNNKKLVGWDEILEGGLAKSATVMSWRGMKGGIESAKAGHDVVMCPTSHCYFDYYQADPEASPEAFGGYTTLKKVYSFNPIPEELSKSESKHILGAQGNLWTEYVQTPDLAQYRVLPRMSALSEVLWSGPNKNKYDDFYFRLKNLEKRFEVLGWNYAPGSYKVSINVDPTSHNLEHKIILSSEKPGEIIKFTLDDSEPNINSASYEEPIVIDKKTIIKASLFIENQQKGKVARKTIYFSKAIGKNIKYNTLYSNRYTGSGNLTLVDGLTGSIAHNDKYWQGWSQQNMDITIDLSKEEQVSKITIGFLESHGSWIFLPTKVMLSFSNDGLSFNNNTIISVSDGKQNGTANRIEVESEDLKISAQYIKIEAINRGECPNWHPGAGGKTWLFSDEIIIE